MTTGYEVKMYADIARLADAAERIAAALERANDIAATPPARTTGGPSQHWRDQLRLRQ